MMNDNTYSLKIVFDKDRITSHEFIRIVYKLLKEALPDIEIDVDTATYGRPLLTIRGCLEDIDKCHGIIDKTLIRELQYLPFRVRDEVGDKIRIQAYPILSRVEQDLRAFIFRVIVEILGFDWWEKYGWLAIPKAGMFKDKIKKRHHLLELCQFDDLLKLMEAKVWDSEQTLPAVDVWEILSDSQTVNDAKAKLGEKVSKTNIWDKIFAPYFDDEQRKKFKDNLRLIIDYRNTVMHHRPFYLNELSVLEDKADEFNQILSSAKGKLPSETLLEVQRDADRLHQVVIDVLRSDDRLDELFYDRAIPLDRLKSNPSPSSEDVARVVEAIKDSSLFSYFFHDLANPAWVKLLREQGVFDRPPSRVYLDEDTYTFPTWPVSIYLARVADQVPEETVEIILGISTDNPMVQMDMIAAALKLPPDIGAKIVPAIDSWLQNAEGTLYIDELAEFLGYLAENGQTDAALELFRILTTPAELSIDETKRRFVRPHPRYDTYWLGHVLHAAQPLLDNHPLETLLILRNQLEAADTQMEGSSYWRPAIEDSGQNWNTEDYPNTILTTVRQLMEYQARDDPDSIRDMVKSDLGHRLPIYNRFAIHLSRMFPDTFPEVTEILLSDRRYLDNIELYHEYSLLLRECYPNLSKLQQDKVLDWILDGPHDIEVDEPQKRWWIGRRLRLIEEYLPQEIRDRFDELRPPDRDPEEDLFLVYSRGGVSWVAGDMSPKDAEQLGEMSDDELVAYLISPQEESTYGETKRELAHMLEVVVTRQPSRFAKLAPRFYELDYAYIYHFLSSLTQAWKSGQQFDLQPVLELCKQLTQRVRSPEESSGDYSYGAVLGRVSVLMKAMVQHDDHAVPARLQTHVRDILIAILSEREDPTDLQWAMRHDVDPVHAAINSEHGRAMDALLSYALHYSRTQLPKPQEEGSFPPGEHLETEVKTLLTDLLDVEKEPNLAVRVWYGAYFPQLMYLDRNWAIENLGRIFPEGPESISYWQAAWDGYLFFSQLYEQVYKVLRPQYQRAITLLAKGEQPEDPSLYRADTQRKLAHHIASFYLLDQERLDDKDSLINQFLSNAGDRDRANIALFFANKDIVCDESLWAKLRDYWQTRIKDFDPKVPQDYALESQAFTMWLSHVPESFERIYDLVEPISKMVLKVWSGGTDILRYLDVNKESYPVLAGRILWILTERLVRYLSVGSNEKIIAAILREMIDSGDQEAGILASRIINCFGENNIHVYKSLLYPN